MRDESERYDSLQAAWVKSCSERDDWREIADRLAVRLMYSDFCDNGHVAIEPNCANCADREAMRIYREAGGTVRLPISKGPGVPLSEIRFSDGTQTEEGE